MPLSIRDGNSSLTTLSTIVVSSAHIPAHTVVSLGSQAITDIAGAVSGVELGPNTISALENISVTFGVGTSITIGNVVSVTGGLTNAELRASSVTIGGSVSVSNLPATQTVTFTQASVTFGQAVVSASNINSLLQSVGTDNTMDANLQFMKIGGHQDGSNQTSHIVHVSSGGAMKVDATGSSITFGAITGAVSVLNLPSTQTVTFTQASVTFSATTGSVSVLNFPNTQTISGTVTANLSSSNLNSVTIGVRGSVTASISNSVTIASIPAITGSVSILNFPASQTISGTVTANVASSSNIGVGFRDAFGNLLNINNIGISLPIAPYSLSGEIAIKDEGGNPANSGIGIGHNSNGEFKIVGENSPLPISGTVTANGGNFVGEQSDAVAPSKIVQIGWYDDTNSEFLRTSKNDRFPVGNAILESVVKSNGDSIGTAVVVAFDNAGSAQIPSATNPLPISGTVTAKGETGTDTAESVFDAGKTGFIALAGDDVNTAVPLKTDADRNLLVSGTVTANVGITSEADVTQFGEWIANGFSAAQPTIAVIGSSAGQPFPVSGTVTANVANIPYVKITDEANNGASVDESNSGLFVSVAGSVTIPISGTVTANAGNFIIQSTDSAGNPYFDFNFVPVGGKNWDNDLNKGLNLDDEGRIKVASLPAISGTVTVGNTLTIAGTVTANPTGTQTIAGTVTANLNSTNLNDALSYFCANTGELLPVRIDAVLANVPVSGTVTIGNTVTVAQLGSVTIGAMPNGSLTARFGTPTTANTAFATNAVTNASRKYLLIQNVTTGSNVITVGIGFTPTTTQGVQLSSGSGIVFESSYIPTGAVYVLSSVTQSNFTILEA